MLCPKDGDTPLALAALPAGPAAYCCSDCQGAWIPAELYADWQAQQLGRLSPPDPSQLEPLPASFAPGLYDAKGALCPECHNYLARVKVGLSLGGTFYLERCKHCGGAWCDGGEWEALGTLGLQGAIAQLFLPQWQEGVRDREAFLQERRAVIDKLGPDLAAEVFELAGVLERHPNGDFAVAYLMRRFDNPPPKSDRV